MIWLKNWCHFLTTQKNRLTNPTSCPRNLPDKGKIWSTTFDEIISLLKLALVIQTLIVDSVSSLHVKEKASPAVILVAINWPDFGQKHAQKVACLTFFFHHQFDGCRVKLMISQLVSGLEEGEELEKAEFDPLFLS